MKPVGWLILSASIFGLYKMLTARWEEPPYQLPERIPADMTETHKTILEELPSDVYIILGVLEASGEITMRSALLSRSYATH